jgi:hypothetical protein
MIRCTAHCFDFARRLSLHGFAVAVRAGSDRPRTGAGYSCAVCGTRYELHPARPAARAA